MTYKSYKIAYIMKIMRKTLYVDKDTNNILDQMPDKKQSEFVREAVKHYFYNKDKPNSENIPQKTILTIKGVKF